ncbi:MAG: helix-turn-helix domain containing protein, partial [Eubacteriaceae bacterium]|nr:helix-turn-helix domain containing protein [Eubacteriaceae bacterium]
MQQRAERTRSEILLASEMEFSDKGFSGARVDEIAARAGVNKNLIYKYFGNKESLYKTVFVIVYDRFS